MVTVMPAAPWRLIAVASYAVQIAGSLLLLLAAGQSSFLLLIGVMLFGAGIGNATSLPPLIVQSEFAKEDVARVIALIVAVAQGTYAFAPAVFGALRAATPGAAPKKIVSLPRCARASSSVARLETGSGSGRSSVIF